MWRLHEFKSVAKLDQSVVSWPGKEGHSPSRIDFNERLLYEENVPLCPSRELTTALPHALRVLPQPS